MSFLDRFFPQIFGNRPAGPGGNIVSPPQFDDLQKAGIGSRFDIAAGKIDRNLALKTLDVADSTLISNDGDKIHYSYQYFHRYKLDGEFHVHIHWFQSQAAVPNFWMRWRVVKNGEDTGPWTEAAVNNDRFNWTAGRILQISEFPEIDLGPLNIAVSDFIDIEITRDTDNSSGLFSGADPVSGDISIRDIDPHVEVDSSGSNQEYVK